MTIKIISRGPTVILTFYRAGGDTVSKENSLKRKARVSDLPTLEIFFKRAQFLALKKRQLSVDVLRDISKDESFFCVSVCGDVRRLD